MSYGIEDYAIKNYQTVKLNTARNCLRYIIRAFDIKEIYIPYYICPSVRNAILKENCTIKYYHVDCCFGPEDNLPKDAFILYPNYFGVCDIFVSDLADNYKNLIVDNAHAFYYEPKGIASFNSVRKFFPHLQDGAFLYTKKTLTEDFPQDEHSYTPHKLTEEELLKNENRLDSEDIKFMSECTEKYLEDIDFEEDKHKRISNYYNLKDRFKATNTITPYLMEDVPFAYPYIPATFEEAENTVKKLTDEGYTIYRYWNNLPDSFEEKKFYTNLVAVPVIK